MIEKQIYDQAQERIKNEAIRWRLTFRKLRKVLFVNMLNKLRQNLSMFIMKIVFTNQLWQQRDLWVYIQDIRIQIMLIL